MRVIIVDDERNARENLQDKLSQIPSVIVTAEFANPLDAFEYIKENIVDVVFLDIEMYEMTGIEMAKQIKDICPKTNIVFVTGYSQYMGQAFSLHASGYLLKPVTCDAILKELENLRYPVNIKTDAGIFVRTFGNFEVFVGGKPLCFSRSKSKELFAYLIHKRGASCNAKEIAAVLFEDKEDTLSLQKQVQTIISVMLKTLKEAGLHNIIIRTFNSTAVDVSKINCDYYRFLNGDTKAVNEYTGEYMSNYYWAEFTTGFLDQKSR